MKNGILTLALSTLVASSAFAATSKIEQAYEALKGGVPGSCKIINMVYTPATGMASETLLLSIQDISGHQVDATLTSALSPAPFGVFTLKTGTDHKGQWQNFDYTNVVMNVSAGVNEGSSTEVSFVAYAGLGITYLHISTSMANATNPNGIEARVECVAPM